MIERARVSEAYTDALEAMGICGLVRHQLNAMAMNGDLDADDCAKAVSVVLKTMDRVTEILSEIETSERVVSE